MLKPLCMLNDAKTIMYEVWFKHKQSSSKIKFKTWSQFNLAKFNASKELWIIGYFINYIYIHQDASISII